MHVDPGVTEIGGNPLPGYASGVAGYASVPGSASVAAPAVTTAVPPPPVAKGAACPVRAPAERDDISLLVLLCGECGRGEEHNPKQC